jgi:AraC-like DNA-binding protein
VQYVERRPVGELREEIECLWAVWDDDSAPHRLPERIVPDGCPELILHLGEPFARLDDSAWRTQGAAFLAGTLSKPWSLRPGRRVRTLGVRFRPGAAWGVLGVSLEGTSDRETGLQDLMGGSGVELENTVGETSGIDAGLAAAEAWLQKQRRVIRPRASEARPAVGLILSRRGAIRIEEVARSLGWSRRRLERAFAREVGVSPKRFARIVRLNSVLATLDGTERERAVDVALDAGYFDQSHLLRDFMDLVGASPRRLDGGELSRQLIRPERLRALLAGDSCGP